MPNSDRFVVYEGKRKRDPRLTARIIAEDGRAFFVIREDALCGGRADGEPTNLLDAISEAFRRAGIELPT